ncbi:MAG: cupin domain-containing protein [Chloroflexi bacterium]|nr:MAG: cupin domain-containing protein [Chloroflexota bacterium]
MQDLTFTSAAPKLRMPGATLVTRLKVYDTETPDGQRGGTPHHHFMCTEMYFVLGGSGAVEMIDANGFSRVDLNLHSALIFSPGTIHRLINPNGDLEILVIMQNSGLPERGDNVVCFSDEWLSSDEKFAEAMSVSTIEDAYQRRNRGVEGFLKLKAAFEESHEQGLAALTRYYALANARTAHLRTEWQDIISQGAQAEAERSKENLAALNDNNIDFLMQAQHYLIHVGDYDKLGFCGRLDRYFDPATLLPEGVKQD